MGSPFMVEDILYFVQPQVLERLLTGQFIAKRQQNKAYQMRDRRNMLSPLNVTRRAIRYVPLVFSNRRQQIIDAVNELNDPKIKLLLVSGPEGRGKTSFIRGMVEMMGGGKEQLLWFDVSRHTNFDEVIRFLLEYMTYLVRESENITDVENIADPIASLEALLRQAKDFPILIAIDNMEYLVAPDQTIRSRELKEAFNFLLSFPNVKLILAGRVLPYADMNPAASAVCNIPLPALDFEISQALLADIIRIPELKTHDFSDLVPFFKGEPYLLFLFAKLYERHPDPAAWLNLLTEQSPEKVLLHYLYQHLSPTEQKILSILSLLRHSATPSGLQAIVNACDSNLSTFDFKQLDHSYIRLMLKKVYPPQMVMSKLRNRHTTGESEAIEAYYQLSEIFTERIARQLSEEEASQYHANLQRFYLEEKGKHVLERAYQARISQLVAEAQYHYSRIRKRRTSVGSFSDYLTTDPADFEPMTSVADTYPNPVKPMQPAEAQEDAEDSEQLDLEAEFTPDMVEIVEPEEEISAYVDKKSAHVTRIPITLQVEPTTQATPQLRLSDEDLERLADLIAKADYRPKTPKHSPTPKASPPVSAGSPPVPAEHPPVLPQTPSSEEAVLDPLVSLQDLDLTEPDPEEENILALLHLAIEQHHLPDVIAELINLAEHRLQKGLYQNTELCLLKAQELAEREHSPPLLIQIHGLLGHLYRHRYQHNKALRHLREVEHLCEANRLQDETAKTFLSQAYIDMAEVYYFRKDLKEAVDAFQKSLMLKPDDQKTKAEIMFRLAMAFDEAGDVHEAIRYYQAAFNISMVLEDDGACAATLYNLASLYFEQSLLQEARTTMQQCLVYDKRIGAHKEVFRSLMFLSKIAEAQHYITESQKFALKAYRLAQTAGNKTAMATACVRLGKLSELTENWQEAAYYYREADTVGANELSEESRTQILQKLKTIEARLT